MAHIGAKLTGSNAGVTNPVGVGKTALDASRIGVVGALRVAVLDSPCFTGGSVPGMATKTIKPQPQIPIFTAPAVERFKIAASIVKAKTGTRNAAKAITRGGEVANRMGGGKKSRVQPLHIIRGKPVVRVKIYQHVSGGKPVRCILGTGVVPVLWGRGTPCFHKWAPKL